MSRDSYRKFCFEHKYRYCVPENFKLTLGVTDQEGEEALKLLRASMPSKAQTRYNERDIKKRPKQKHQLN
jgi:hypothetical protein